MSVYGVGYETAGQLLDTADDNPDRLRHEQSFAALCGASPVQASSGRTTRHRLNRGGDCQANSALWTVVLVRMVSHPPTLAYVERHTADGLSKPEIMRCLNRYVARALFRFVQTITDRHPSRIETPNAAKLLLDIKRRLTSQRHAASPPQGSQSGARRSRGWQHGCGC